MVSGVGLSTRAFCEPLLEFHPRVIQAFRAYQNVSAIFRLKDGVEADQKSIESKTIDRTGERITFGSRALLQS